MYILGTIWTTIITARLLEVMTAVSPEYMAILVMGSFVLYVILYKKGGS